MLYIVQTNLVSDYKIFKTKKKKLNMQHLCDILHPDDNRVKSFILIINKINKIIFD